MRRHHERGNPPGAAAWNHCLGDGSGVQNLAFACNTNAGTSFLIGSCVLDDDYAQATAAWRPR